ncbi:MAG: HK97 family phage prohead protease [Gammaproteobacteria bacterium]|nr:HK97 family phage prohead protease [Gammaproteobacteria bacterium]
MNNVASLREWQTFDETKCLAGSIKRASDTGEFEAVIATLNVIDSDGDIIAPGALDGVSASIVPAHNHSSVPLGKARLHDRGSEVIATGILNLDIEPGEQWHTALKFDLANPPSVQEWSFGYRVLDSEIETRDGEQVRVIKRMDVMEISPVLRGAGVDTRTLAVKHRTSVGRDMLGKTGIEEKSLNAFMSIEAKLLASDIIRSERDLNHSKTHRYKFEFCELDAAKSSAAVGCAAMIADSLEIEAPTIKFFRPSATQVDFSRKNDIDGLALCGRKVDGKRLIYVREDAVDEMIDTISHEVRHLWQYESGWDMSDSRLTEDDAHLFGNSVKCLLGIPGYADLSISVGDPPKDVGHIRNASCDFHVNRKTGAVHQGRGFGPHPVWHLVRTVDLDSLR